MEPRIQYATTEDGVSIAYWTMGKGGTPLLITAPLGFGHIALECQDASLFAWYRHLAESRTIVRFDNRGEGMSQRQIQENTISPHHHAIDMDAVCKSLDFEHVNVLGLTGNCMKAAAFAAQHRQLVDQLIFWVPINGPDFHQAQMGTVVSLASKDWKVFTEAWAQMTMGWSGGQRAGEYASFVRESMTQELFVRFLEVIGEWDITPYLSEIEAQTLVLSGRAGSPESLQLVASGVRNAQLVRLPDSPLVYWEDEHALKVIEEFLGDAPVAAREESKSTLPSGTAETFTILFTDVEGSTALTQRLGDAKARELLREHERMVREALKAHGGSEVKTMGDGFMASFSSATKALHCAIAMQRAFAERNSVRPEPVEGRGEEIRIRVGLNAGEPIAEDDDLFGTAVNLAARICGHAEAGQILAPIVVRELAAGKQFMFADLGETELRGFEDPVRLFELSWRES
ncbi:MAG: adenylate/guanylate cyclase domain-containing protein [Chloroflexi bacterium]|nr:adenylate/guanylate cyclase domain-containing protein [Chloroflexota bacterium]